MLVRFVMRAQPDLAPPGSLRRNRPRDDTAEIGVVLAWGKRHVRGPCRKRNCLTAATALVNVNV